MVSRDFTIDEEESHQVIDGSPSGAARANLVRDASLSPGFTVAQPYRRHRLEGGATTLLTGGTGFLGAHLLAQLAATGDFVVCLARATATVSAAERVRKALEYYELWRPDIEARIEVIDSDLSRPDLGLGPATLDRLAHDVDLILHNGARVHLLEPYRRLRPANVDALRRLLDLASTRATPLHFVSSISSQVPHGGGSGHLTEDHVTAAEDLPESGYAQSKWVGETMVLDAGRHGLSTSISRPSRISGHAVTGAVAKHDAFWHFVRACLELRAVPAEGPGWHGMRESLVPVDYVAALVVAAARQASEQPLTINIVNQESTSLAEVIAGARRLGYEAEEMPFGTWRSRLWAAAVDAPTTTRTSTREVALMVPDEEPDPDEELPFRSYDDANAAALRSETGIEPVAITPHVIERYLKHLLFSNYLPPPR